MKRIKYSILRRITFAVYLLTTVIFCIYLVKLGSEEVAKAKSYTEKEKQYVEKLLACREAMNSVEKSFNQIQRSQSILSIRNFIDKLTLFRHSISRLSTLEKESKSRSFMSDSRLNEYATIIYSVSNTLISDVKSPESEKGILVNEDLDKITKIMDAIRYELQERLNVELNHVENWQNQSLYFFEELELLLVSFFILATLFSLTAFAISGHVLRRYLGFLSFGANEISSGNLDYRFNDTTTDVIGEVMRDFDGMAIQLQKQTNILEKINREIQKKATELEEAHLHKDRFLANMSHELRTPLNSIIGFSDLLIAKSKALSPEKTDEFAKKILSAAEHLLELISDLLEIAKVDAGVLTIHPENFNLKLLVKNAIEMMQPMADKKNLELKLVLPQHKITINADKRLIRQVLINLINNALKYSKKGNVTVSVTEFNKNLKIEIADTGIGISEKDVKLIFNDFHRVEQGLTSNYEGVGLGLTLSKRIIELHKGEIKVQSKLKRGSTFTVILPNNT